MKIAFRADASAEIGTGHLMRCLTLADLLRTRGTKTRFLCRHITDALGAEVRQRDHELCILPRRAEHDADHRLKHSRWLHCSQQRDAEDSRQALQDHTWDWLIVDHYAIDAAWESALREIVPNVMVIDDLADRHHDCDLLLDQNFYSDCDQRYLGKTPERCVMLLGPRYALLRGEFSQWRKKVVARTGPVTRLLVFLGGVDARNHTSRVLDALAQLDNHGLHVDVVIGASHPEPERVKAACAENGFSCHVQTRRMAELVARADLAIGAGGSATWERCCLGLPTLTLSIADNQRQVVTDAAQAGLLYAPDMLDASVDDLVLHLSSLISNANLRSAMSHNALRAVDGLGTNRVATQIGCTDIALRRAEFADSTALFEWRNHPTVRGACRSQQVIPWQTHCSWLQSTLADTDKELLIGTRDGAPVGVVRFDLSDNRAEISIYLVPGTAVPGTGRDLLVAAERWLTKQRPAVSAILANVLADNQPSHRLFRSAGYSVDSTWYSKALTTS